MRKLVLAGLLTLCGCGNEARVLSHDGSKQLAYCDLYNYVQCLAEACPSGYDIIERGHPSDFIVRCKP